MTTYPKNFITKVIARVDFHPILKLKTEEPTILQEAIRGDFPRFGQAVSMGITFKPGELPVASEKPLTWKFTSKDNNSTIELDYKHIALVLDKYINYELFFQKVELMYNNFMRIYNPTIIKRVGLRFINEINSKGDPFDWDGYINEYLYCTINAFPDLSNKLTRLMSQMHMNLEDRMLLFQFGIFNSEFPNLITQKNFILDYDCSSREECEPDSVLSKFGLFYEDIKKIFKLSRGERLLKIMKGEEDEGI